MDRLARTHASAHAFVPTTNATSDTRLLIMISITITIRIIVRVIELMHSE